MAKPSKDTISIMLDKKTKKKVEVMPVREFALTELTVEQTAYLIGLGLKQRDGALVRSRIKKILPKIQENISRRAEMEAMGMEKEMLDTLFKKPGWEIELPGQVHLSLKDYFNTEETPDEETETDSEPEETEETPAAAEPKDGKKNGKGRK